MLQLIHGDNIFESDQALAKLLKGSHRIIDGGALKDIDKITDSTDTISLFTANTQTIVKKFYENPKKVVLHKKLLAWLKSLKELPDLVFYEDHLIDTDRYGRPNKKPGALQSFILEKGKVEIYTPKNNALLKKWVSTIMNKQGINVPAFLLDLILIRVGSDQMQLYQELNKLNLFVKAQGKQELEEQDLQILTLNEPDHVIWDLTNAIAARNKGRALELNEMMMMEQTDALMIISATVKQLSQMLLVKLHPHQRSELMTTLGIQDFMLNRLSSSAAAFPEKHLRMLINKFIQLDSSVKQGLIDVKLGFTLLIISL